MSITEGIDLTNEKTDTKLLNAVTSVSRIGVGLIPQRHHPKHFESAKWRTETQPGQSKLAVIS